MKTYINDVEHYFILIKNEKYPLNVVNGDNILVLNHSVDLLFNSNVQILIKNCEKFIISGLFEVIEFIDFYDNAVWNKVYLQFWGGDFYTFRDINKNANLLLQRHITLKCINKCQGIINLIEEDYSELLKVFPVKKKHFVASMPMDPIELKSIRFEEYIENYLKTEKKVCRITLGNSAAIENNHIEAFNLLKHLKNDNIEICSPLSYGNMNYREQVIEIGKQYFGKKFNPLTELMEKKEYIRYLSTCDIGIFNNNRQQGMGNILYLLRMGKKVYLRKDTAMYNSFIRRGFFIHNIEEVASSNLKTLTYISDDEITNNISVAKKILGYEYEAGLWQKVFSDQIV